MLCNQEGLGSGIYMYTYVCRYIYEDNYEACMHMLWNQQGRGSGGKYEDVEAYEDVEVYVG